MSMFPELPGSAQAQRLFSANASLPLGLVEAATIFGYLTMRDAQDRDVPAAAAWRVRRYTDYYVGAVLMELALQGRVGMDKPTSLEDHAYWYEWRRKHSWKPLWLFVPLVALFLACWLAYQHAYLRLAFILLLVCMAYVPLTLLLLVVLSLFSREQRIQRKLGVVDPTPTGNAVLDVILRQMMATGKSRRVYNWLYGSRALSAAGLYAITEGRLAEHGWITPTGEQPFLGLFKVDTLVLNRHTEQWQVLSQQLRSALLLGDAPSPDMVALLLCLTLLDETFLTHHHLRLPGQPMRKVVSSLEQILSSPEEVMIARQRLQALMQGDQVIAAAIGERLYDTLLSIRNGVERSVEARRQTSAG